MTVHQGRRDYRVARCDDCGAATLTGWDRDTAAFRATVDNEPVTHRGELLAVITGRRTYTTWGRELHPRDSLALAHPAHGPAYAEHRCWQPLPLAWLEPQQTAFPTAATDEPEF